MQRLNKYQTLKYKQTIADNIDISEIILEKERGGRENITNEGYVHVCV